MSRRRIDWNIISRNTVFFFKFQSAQQNYSKYKSRFRKRSSSGNRRYEKKKKTTVIYHIRNEAFCMEVVKIRRRLVKANNLKKKKLYILI